jgi:hypothetical protein
MARVALARVAQTNKQFQFDADATDGTDSSGDDDSGDEVATPTNRRPPAKRAAAATKRQTRAKKTTRAKTAPPVVAVDERPRARYSMAKHEDIMREIGDKILFQPLAVDHICNLLLSAHIGGGSFFYSGVHARMYKRILSGPSGVGKTEMVRTLRHWFCMDKGDYWEHQFVDVDASECKDQTLVNKVIGSGSGYADSDSRHTMVHRLIAACKSPQLKLAEQMADKKSAAYRAAMREYEREGDPPFIMLFIDEIDKAHLDFMNAMNGLLGEGTMEASTGGHRFRVPDKTSLIIVFTSNYGSREIARMPMENDLEAIDYVEAAMGVHGLGKHSIERIGSHIIFYRIADDDMRVVIRRKIEQCVNDPQQQLTQKYGAIEYEGAIQCITDFIVSITDPERGIRGSLKQLDNCLRPLLTETFRKLEAMPREQFESLVRGGGGDSPALSLFKETLQLELLEDASLVADWTAQRPAHLPSGRDIVHAIQSTAQNEFQLKLYRGGTEREIHAVGIAQGGSVINCSVVPYMVVKNQYNITQYGSEDHKQLKGDYRNLHGRYTALRDAVSSDNQPLIAELIQEAPPPKLDLSDDDDDDDEANVVVGALPAPLEAAVAQMAGPVKKRRKLCIEETHCVELEARVPERPVLTDRVEEVQYDEVDEREEKRGDSRAGRPPRTFDGFTFLCYRGGHSYHRCNCCQKQVGRQYIVHHQCTEK